MKAKASADEKMHMTGLAIVGQSRNEIAIGGVYATPLGCIIHDASDEDILAASEKAVWLENAAVYVQADLLAAAKARGKAVFCQVAEQLQFDYSAGKKALNIANVPIAIRRVELTPAHHWAVGRFAKTLTEEQQKTWLSAAIEHKLTPGELARSIRDGAVVQRAHAGSANVRTPWAVRAAMNAWLRNLGDGGWKKFSNDTIEDLLAELETVEQTIAEMRKWVAENVELDLGHDVDGRAE